MRNPVRLTGFYEPRFRLSEHIGSVKTRRPYGSVPLVNQIGATVVTNLVAVAVRVPGNPRFFEIYESR